MHNWYEGVLQHHFRIRWGFNIKVKDQDSENTNKDKSDSDNIPDENSTLTITKKENLQKLLLTVIVPPGIAAVPKGVGTASNGKLKASEWHSLFAKHLPLVALEAFGNVWSAGNRDRKISLLNNLCSLVECTHFVECKSITEETCAKFEINYALYCRTSETLFEGISIQPNHHYALHIGQLSRLLGPLISLSKFGGERLNGLLQSMPTNNLIDSMTSSKKKRFSKLSMVAPIQEVNTHLDLAIYEVLLAHLKKAHSNLRDYRDMPHPLEAKILTWNVQKINTAKIKDKTRVSTKKPHIGIWWDCDGQQSFGFVIDIIRIPDLDEGTMQVVIERTDLVNLAYVANVKPEWVQILDQMKVAVGYVASACYNLIDASSIGGHCVYREISVGTMGNKHALVLWMAVEYSTNLDRDPMELLSMVVE
ncbi:hypothetical protein VP01_999g3 [Puccinia sorghi]|uniref:Uncharacterized protein n=1 Tax=Puccinia sorghi TaxID=27349 RepID=A0A0L6U5Q0_9BASI|nr:hypothetical protein VP01_999g3 [Puccinia sorghi]